MERAEWLEARKKGLGSSDAAAACGLSRWGTPLSVYLEKLNLAPPREMSEEQRWGLLHEETIAREYERRTGVKLVNPMTLYHCDRHPFLLATPDRFDAAHTRIVELKTARSAEGWGEEGTDDIPQEYVIQVAHQQAVLDLDLAEVAVLIGGSDFRIYRVPRNAALIDSLIAIEADLWRKIANRTAPEPDWAHPRTPELVELLYRPASGKSVDLGEDAAALAQVYQGLGAAIREQEEARAEAKARLVQLLGDAEEGRLPDGQRVRRRQVDEAQISYTRKAYCEFRILQPKKEKIHRE